MLKKIGGKFNIHIEQVWGGMVILGVFIFMNLQTIRPNDFWFHLAYGKLFSQTGGLSIVDTFSFTAFGEPYLSAYHYWLGQFWMYLFYQWGGAEAILFVFSTIVTLAYGIILLLGFKRTRNGRAAALGALFAALLGVSNWNIRPQLFAYLWAAVLMWAMDGCQTSRRKWLRAGLMMVTTALWVNTHGTFFIPFALVGAQWVEDAWLAWKERDAGKLIPALGFSGAILLGSLFNPRGVGVFSYLWQMSASNSVQQYVAEWQPALWNRPDGLLFFLLLGALFLLWALSGYRPTMREWVSLVFFTLLALRYQRGIVWFGLTQAVFFSQCIALLLSKAKKRLDTEGNAVLNRAMAVMFLVLAWGSLPWFRSAWALAPEKKSIYGLETPFAAVNALQTSKEQGRVFSEIAFSGYVTWKTEAQFKVFIDPRFELYPAELWQTYLKVGAGMPGWEMILNEWEVDVLLLSPQSQAGLLAAAQESPGWEKVYEDDISVLLMRR